ncbi:MAG: sensor histidine kinase [Bacteroidales bacterium]
MTKYQTVARYRDQLITVEVDEPEAVLLIRVSNFDHRKSGITGSIRIGLPDQMQEAAMRRWMRAHVLLGILLISGIYFLFLHAIRADKFRLSFSLLCLLVALRVFLVNGMPQLDALHLSAVNVERIKYIDISLIIPLVVMLVSILFPFEFPRRLLNPILGLFGLLVLVILVAPISMFSYLIPVMFGLYILVCLLFIHVLALAWIRGRKDVPLYTLGFLFLLAGVLYDLAVEVSFLEADSMAQWGMLLFLATFALVYSDNQNQVYRKSEELSAELEMVRNNLESMVEERTEALQTLSRELEQQKKKLEEGNKELRESMLARNRLFAIIGHDVKAPIGYLRQALEMLIDDDLKGEREQKDVLRMMASSAEVTYNLLDNLLVWGRSQTGRLRANPQVFCLLDLVDEGLELVAVGLKEKELKVEVFVNEEHCVNADRDQLFVVIRNLLSNAMKFTPAQGSIVLSSRKNNGQILLSVRDTGIGIPEPILSKIKGNKEQITTQGTQGEKGSGLGLQICREIMETNHGWMEMQSESGKGTTITLGIPSVLRVDVASETSTET